MSLKKLILTILLAPALLAAFLFVTRWSGASGQAATPAVPDKITITGQVAMGTTGLTLPITTSLLLHANDGHEMALRLDGQADAQGAFRFEGLENKPGRTFDIMAIVGPTTYFAEQIVPQDGQAEYKAAIKIFGTTKDTSTLRVDRLHNFVEFINRQQVRATEIYVLSNTGDRTIEGGETTADGKPVTLRFDLPAGAGQVRFEGGELGARFFRTADGFLDAQGVPPGERSSQVLVSYVLPYNGQTHLEHRVNYPVQGIDVILPADAGIGLTGKALAARGTQAAPNGTTMQIFSGQALPAGGSLAYDLSGELSAAQASLLDGGAPQDAAPQAATGPLGSLVRALLSSVRGSPVSAAVTSAGLFLLAVALLLWLRVRGKEQAVAKIADPAAERNALVQAIADLDDARAAGLIEAEEYQAQRRRLLDRLLALAEKGRPLASQARSEG